VNTILNEDFAFKLEDLYNIKDIQKLFTSKDQMVEGLQTLPEIVKVNCNEASIILPEGLVVYNLINVPNKMTKEQLIAALGVDEGLFKRVYKQSLYWTLISDDEGLNSSLEGVLKKVKFEDDKVLRYEITPSKVLTRQVQKKLQNLAYQKETNELKAGAGLTASNVSIRKDSYNKDNKLSTNSNEAWRRRSEISTNSSSKEE
jgi:hypothetical protein